MVKEGYYFGLPPFLLGLLSISFGTPLTIGVGVVLVCFALFVFYFFRNPEREIPVEPSAVVAPGDGRVVVVKDEPYNGQPGKRISIFLAVWNVHVNRSPAAGTITRLEYKPGKFMAAWAENASIDNEQNIFTLASEHGEIVFKQIAGLIARRVVSWKKSGDTVARGERIGLVRFGSRVDLWMPADAEIAVRVGQNVKGGSTVVARMAAAVPKRSASPLPSKSASQKLAEQEGGA